MPDPYWEKIGEEAKKARELRGLAMTPVPRRVAGKKGYRKYWCGSCGFHQFEHWIRRTRAARLRCPSCGSLNYEPHSIEAKDDIARKNDARKAVDGEQGTGDGKFVIGQ